MPYPNNIQDSITLTIPNGTKPSPFVPLGNPSEIGLFVPALTSCTLTVQVALDAAGTGAVTLVGGTGTAILTIPTTTGAYALGSDVLKPALGYAFIGVNSSVNQGADRVFTLTRKITGSDPTA